jgi:hypothetical protein
VSTTRKITDYQSGKGFRFDTTLEAKTKDKYHQEDPYKPRAGNPYLLMGALAGLDSPGEWFLDQAARTVYLWAPDGKSPAAHTIEVKQRDYALDLSKLSFIEINGVDILGAAVNMADSRNCLPANNPDQMMAGLLEDCRLRQPPTANRELKTENRNMASAAFPVRGWRLPVAGENNRLTNSIIHDVNYIGSGRGGLDLAGSRGAVISHCSIFRTGRDNIQHGGSKHIRIEYCDIYHTNMLNADSGAIYAWGTDGEGGVIAYNWVHDNLGDSTANRQPLTANREPEHGDSRIPGSRLPVAGCRLSPRTLGPELHHNAPGAVDKDGYPAAGSAAIDAGVEVAGITEGFKGKAPDLGAYELGGTRWTAGADWKDADAPAAPARNLAYSPHPPLSEKNMITEGLALWLDAADKTTVDIEANATVSAWRDKSPHKRMALPALPGGSVKWVQDAASGKPVMRGNGTGSLRVADLKGEPKPVMVFVVSQALEAAGPTWQRIIASFTGVGQEWVLPNWIIPVPGGQKPTTWPARVFVFRQRDGAALGTITVLGASAVQGQALGGDVGEVLVFDRLLRFDEFEAVSNYLKAKWGIK